MNSVCAPWHASAWTLPCGCICSMGCMSSSSLCYWPSTLSLMMTKFYSAEPNKAVIIVFFDSTFHKSFCSRLCFSCHWQTSLVGFLFLSLFCFGDSGARSNWGKWGFFRDSCHDAAAHLSFSSVVKSGHVVLVQHVKIGSCPTEQPLSLLLQNIIRLLKIPDGLRQPLVKGTQWTYVDFQVCAESKS